MIVFNSKKSFFVIIAILGVLFTACKTNPKQDVNSKDKENIVRNIEFEFQKITGVGSDSIYNRRDNSDIIKVEDTYYMWYSRMKSPITSGYWATIWYATSKDNGFTWKEQGMALGLGKKGAFDSHSVFTPNILVHKGKYYLYYTGVKPTPGNSKNEFEGNHTTDITAIGLAVSDSPDGPFLRVENNPVLKISETPKDFDSYRIDDASLTIKEDKVWLFYKGRSIIHGAKGPKLTKMGVAFSEDPKGPFKKNSTPLLDKSHEVLIWNENNGIASLASVNKSINFAEDGIHFSMKSQNLKDIPKAPGLYRPSLSDCCRNEQIPGWGISMIYKNKRVYLRRFEMKKESNVK